MGAMSTPVRRVLLAKPRGYCAGVDRAVQAMGRFGLVRGSVIERLYREARPMRIYEGSTEVILDSLAKQLVKKTLGSGAPG